MQGVGIETNKYIILGISDAKMAEPTSDNISCFVFQIVKGLQHLDEQIREVLKLDEKVLELAKDLYQHKSLLIMGRGYNYATCMEGALVSI